jgi:hypothetical protein
MARSRKGGPGGRRVAFERGAFERSPGSTEVPVRGVVCKATPTTNTTAGVAESPSAAFLEASQKIDLMLKTRR